MDNIFSRLAIFWDVDGVLIDSEPLHTKKLITTARAQGVDLREDDFEREHQFDIPEAGGGVKKATMKLHGAGDKNIYYWLLAQKPALARVYPQRQWLDELLNYYMANAGDLRPRPGMPALVAKLHAAGAVQGVVTSGIPFQVRANLACLNGAENYFNFVIDADSVKQSKPDPEGYLRAFEKVTPLMAARSIAAKEICAIGVEDSEAGVTAVLASGAFCIQYPLPGQAPMTVREDDRQKFCAVTSSDELFSIMRELLTARRPRLASNAARTCYNLNSSPR